MWRVVKRDLYKYVLKCRKCQRDKSHRQIKMQLVLIPVTNKPFNVIYEDLMGPLPESSKGNNCILSTLDNLARSLDFVAIPNPEANTKASSNGIISRYSLP